MGSEHATVAVIFLVLFAVFYWPPPSGRPPIARRPREEGPGHPYRRRVAPDR